MQKEKELTEQVEQLSGLVQELQERLARLEAPAEHPEKERRSRRELLKLGGAAALGAVGAAAMGAVPAAATDGDPIVAGQTKTSESPTIIRSDQAPGQTSEPVFAAQGYLHATPPANIFFGPLQGHGQAGGTGNSAVPTDGVDGFSTGDLSVSVYGLTDTGVGVQGVSLQGVGLYAAGTGRILQDAIDPSSYTPSVDLRYEQVRDPDGRLYISIPAGSAGSVPSASAGADWARAAAFNPFSAPQRIYSANTVRAPGYYGPVSATTNVSGGQTGVPAGASHVYAAVQSYQTGVATLFPDNGANNSNDTFIWNWSGTGTAPSPAGKPLNMLYMLIPLGVNGKFRIHTYFSGEFYIDVWGFLW